MYLVVNGAEKGQTEIFYFVLFALFIVALGFSLQQTAANPFAIALGDPQTGSHRLNLAGGINSFGTTIGPLVVSYIIFGAAALSNEEFTNKILNDEISLKTVQTLYIGIGILFLVAASLFYFSKQFPDFSVIFKCRLLFEWQLWWIF